PGELWGSISYSGLWRLAGRHWRAGLDEVARSFSRRRFGESLRRLVPDISDADLSPGRAGVRAQALDRRGRLCSDFVIERG
ncbi:MAG: L-2-hydroxyglutarate oxidase, partial [Actinobacteria bacterium]|nr:L-2-hydroxyglutarate oxidase [Actinomycetota bacterium]NIS29230.1 L-2-hydroxyglutarate oxidase [Actinomycetota bacterium]NIU18021.1 L-2-hydroxyglutarate oxidase [Actinomycetota bacterium]NIU64623.1 L-2-hydroxyglutarate oxidase [Actinomycetota bacterium]NIV86297.1 L-2-hydroxyglutarate oxidase [Actinomycetota bacterium]